MKRFFNSVASKGPLPFALVLALVMGALSCWWGALNQDEGWYLYASQLVAEGKLPYRDFFFTQGPILPLVYSFFAWIWQGDTVLHGILGGRVITWCIGFAAVLFSAELARRLARDSSPKVAFVTVFSVLAVNLYHVYFTTIPKTYALGFLFLALGFLMLHLALKNEKWRSFDLALSGLAMSLASGTRISLVLVPFVAGVALLFAFRRYRYGFVAFGIGCAIGLGMTYGIAAIDPQSFAGLMAAQAYHAGRGGFDLLFSVGSVSRLVRGYAALGVILLLAFPLSKSEWKRISFVEAVMIVSFAAVFVLQLSAPFPYDDYQVPIMGLVAVPASVAFASRFANAWAPVLIAAMVSFASPLLQEWMANSQDRFWSRVKPMTELAQLRQVAKEINAIDPGGKEIFTQDLYLAIETDRSVPDGFEMGPFSYFPDYDFETASKLHVLNREILDDAIANTEAPIAAGSGYSFAIAVPRCTEVDYETQKHFWEELRKRYELEFVERNFGQNSTTLLVLKKKAVEVAK